MKRIKLNYKPIAKRRSNEVATIVSQKHVDAVNRSIERKIIRNRQERKESEKEAEKYIVG